MIKRVIIPGLLALLMCLIIAGPVAAAGFGMSPKEINLEVPANGSAEATVYIASYGFSGDIQIGLENIPLKVEPETVRIRRSDTGKKVMLTFHGDESLGEQTFQGKMTFLATSEGNVGFGIKIKAVITQTAPVLEEMLPPEEAPTPAEQAPEETPPVPSTPPVPPAPALAPPVPPAPRETSEFPIVPVAGIAAGAAIIITLIIVFVRRPRY